jgi:hypothetical protein
MNCIPIYFVIVFLLLSSWDVSLSLDFHILKPCSFNFGTFFQNQEHIALSSKIKASSMYTLYAPQECIF